ncbi:GTP-binding protein [Mycena venus]|uniref:GTP-binding protein n=1 Tax=Mycena venus TaxID=2733690 RepID=A0A8H7CFI6_9AGAR|nr:GTP-binding protein [Mycena venus]
MSHTIEQIKARCPRFRILVIGRRNAGKTAILKKMCNSDGSDLKIVDKNGKEVDPSILEPDRQRGMSDIENEITFGSNPLFVFHDSRGIEAGAEHDKNLPLCTDSLWEFLDKRSRESRIRNQIHAVWMCIPMDNQRAPSSEFELAFFNARASPVPVIAVFTKFEALIDEAYNDLPEDDLSDTEKEKNASRDAQSKFDKTVRKAIENITHPPDQCVQLQYLNEERTGCAGLTEATYAAIQNETLSDLFAMAQQSSFQIGCKKVMELIIREKEQWIQRVLANKNKILDTIIKYTGYLIPHWRNYQVGVGYLGYLVLTGTPVFCVLSCAASCECSLCLPAL